MTGSIKDKILIIEDEAGIAMFLKTCLRGENYEVLLADNGTDALRMIRSHCPDCILLDLGLPDMDGSEIIQDVRSWTRTPIVVISARSTEWDKADALDQGADDYITKPFSSVELLARIRAALRHTRTIAEHDETALDGKYSVGDMVIDYKKMKVYIRGRDANLTPNEYKIAALLGKHPGRVLTYRMMLKELWGPSAGMDNKILRVHMASIRRKIEDNPTEPRYIMTEVGVGYRMAEKEELPPAEDDQQPGDSR